MKDLKNKKFSFLRKMLIIIFATIFIVSLSFKETISKYIFEENAPYNDDTGIDFTVNSVLVVNTAEELFHAINQGYTYVQLDKKIENPLIITQKAENLNNDLILDLNGIEIQRNGYEPILNINHGVRLTIVDSSAEQTGGLYNPVGSVFKINGGSLSVVTGFFESGPRYSEYYTYNNFVLNHEATSSTKRTIVEEEEQEVNYYSKSSIEPTKKNAPIIKSYPTVTGDVTYNHGNLYFDNSVTKGDITIKKDTYCYYQTSEKSDFEKFDTSMADWHYSYYVEKDTYDYVGTSKKSDSDIEVTIFGYEEVIDKAKKVSNKSEYYAAIQMNSGTLDVQDGSFYQYFGVNTTACVNAQGGIINIVNGNFSSRVPDAKEYKENNVSVKESDKNAFSNVYFNNFEWNNSTSDSSAKRGESYCILNGGSATVKIGKGNLYSSNNNIISMHGGELSISGGSFKKELTNGLNSTINKQYLSAINMQNGKLSVAESEFDIIGDNTYAIYSTVEGNDSFNILNTDFNIKGNNCTGIYSSQGTVRIKSTDSALVSITGAKCKGICVENGGSVISDNYSYKLSGNKSYGIYSTSGSITLNNGNISLPSDDNCYGIYACSDEKINIDITNSTLSIGCTTTATNAINFNSTTKTNTVNASIGVYLSSLNENSYLNLHNTNIYSFELGVVSNGGTINLYDNGSIITNKASAIAIRNGNVNFDENSNYTISSNNTTKDSYQNSYNLTVPTREGTIIKDVEYINTDGIYVYSGSLISKGQLTINHTGLQNRTLSSGYNYASLVVTSYAVRVYGGNVTVEKGTITANVGGGIYVGKNSSGDKGSIILGNENTKELSIDKNSTDTNIVRVYTNGNIVGAQYDAIGTKISDSWKSYQSITGGHAVELDGGNITIYNGIYEAQFGNGIYVNGSSNANEENGSINVYNGVFYGHMNAISQSNNNTIDLKGKSGPSAFYGLKVVGGSVVNIYDGFFDGGNGGAFVTGVTKINNQIISSHKTANVYIYKGTFGQSGGNLDAFNVYDDVNIVFGAYKEEELNNIYGSTNEISSINNAIKLNSTKTSIAANSITYDSSSTIKSQIYVYYGTYSGQMYLETRSDINYSTFNTNTSKGEYTTCNSTILNEVKNSNPQWFTGSFN